MANTTDASPSRIQTLTIHSVNNIKAQSINKMYHSIYDNNPMSIKSKLNELKIAEERDVTDQLKNIEVRLQSASKRQLESTLQKVVQAKENSHRMHSVQTCKEQREISANYDVLYNYVNNHQKI